MALNAKQLRFVALYQASVASGKPNAAQAYSEAYDQPDLRAAKAAASRLLTNGNVQQLLRPAKQAAEVARAGTVRGIEITRDRIRHEMARLAFVNPKALFRDDGTPKRITELDDDTACALASFEVEEEVTDDGTTVRTRKYKLWDKRLALRDLADTEPGVWADPKRDESGGNTTNNVTVNLVNLSDDDLDRLDAILDTAARPPLAVAAPATGAGEGGEGASQAQ